MSLEELKDDLQKLVDQKYGRDLYWYDRFAMVELLIKEKEQENELH